jgi:hypothetical protein
VAAGYGVGFGDGIAFGVAEDGTVTYGPLLDNVLSGRGTCRLTVNDRPIFIDARALTDSTPSFTLIAVGTYQTDTVRRLARAKAKEVPPIKP